MGDTARLREAAALFVKLAKDAGRELALDESGVAWADEYVRAVAPVQDDNQLRVQTALVGSFFGECLVGAGGAWRESAGQWAVELNGGHVEHPFRLTEALLRGTADDSLLEAFRAAMGGDATQAATAAAAEVEPPSVEPIRRVAEQMLGASKSNGGPAEYGEAFVAFVDQFVENARPFEAELMESYVALIGASLGESLIAAYGGEWRHTGDAWLVDLGPRGAVHPFSAARRQLEADGGESILAVFRSVAPDS